MKLAKRNMMVLKEKCKRRGAKPCWRWEFLGTWVQFAVNALLVAGQSYINCLNCRLPVAAFQATAPFCKARFMLRVRNRVNEKVSCETCAGDVNGATKTALKTRYNACTRLHQLSSRTRPIESKLPTKVNLQLGKIRLK